MISRNRQFLVLAAPLLLGACASAFKRSEVAASEPGDYEVRNSTSCYARVVAAAPGSTGGNVFVNDAQELAIVNPGQTAIVTLPSGRRIGVVTYRTATPTPDEPGADCRQTGTVQVKRVAAKP